MIHEELTERIIACAMEVHTALGPGLLESNYQAAMGLELSAAGLSFARERLVPVVYRGVEIGQHRPDFVMDESTRGTLQVNRPRQTRDHVRRERAEDILRRAWAARVVLSCGSP